GNQVFGLFGDMAEGFSFMPHEGLTGFFHAVGSVLAWVVGLFIEVATVVARFVGGIMSGFRDLKGFLAPAFGMAADAIGKLIGEIGKLLGFTDTAADSLNGTVSGFGLAFKGIGTLIGWVAGALSGVIGLAVYTVTILLRILIAIASYIKFVVSSIVDGILFVGQKIGEFSGYIVLLVTEKIPNAFRFLAAIVSFVLLKIANYFVGFYLRLKIQLATIVKGVISYFSPLMTFFERIRDGIRKVIRSIADIALNLLSRIPNVLLPESLIRLKHSGFVSDQSVEKTFVRSERAGSPMPAAAEATRRSDDIGQLRTDLAELARAQSKQSEKDINIKLEVDGETLSRATHKAGQEAAGREFSPVANL
ncbi:MAG: hypothetical protein GY854_26470, partial [Deltaproteobacteria bacterium]|nr:hypothetical protein [Deltaproteobacteria bacterium]